ncbi:hypothetical protein O181_060657 [Austropuccinia psidii MF-1]|uniref:Reverse transcriptase domain-containing protein n=1 Tax=Austropuccinia psidii MF-1 TaxID=1389203 RepID=A0A9Q3EJ35_9BASI|nr:hypothetical protein [Austropuccinia psidii MF-1]
MKEKSIDLLFKCKSALVNDKDPLGSIFGHEVEIIFNVEKPYPPLLRRPDFPSIPRIIEALKVHTIIIWHNGKSRIVGDFRALNNYTIPERYPIPRINETFTQLSHANFITAMDVIKGFHKSFLTENSKKLLRIMIYCGIYENLRIPFGIKNAPSHYQRMMNTIFPEELSEG